MVSETIKRKKERANHKRNCCCCYSGHTEVVKTFHPPADAVFPYIINFNFTDKEDPYYVKPPKRKFHKRYYKLIRANISAAVLKNGRIEAGKYADFPESAVSLEGEPLALIAACSSSNVDQKVGCCGNMLWWRREDGTLSYIYGNNSPIDITADSGISSMTTVCGISTLPINDSFDVIKKTYSPAEILNAESHSVLFIRYQLNKYVVIVDGTIFLNKKDNGITTAEILNTQNGHVLWYLITEIVGSHPQKIEFYLDHTFLFEASAPEDSAVSSSNSCVTTHGDWIVQYRIYPRNGNGIVNSKYHWYTVSSDNSMNKDMEYDVNGIRNEAFLSLLYNHLMLETREREVSGSLYPAVITQYCNGNSISWHQNNSNAFGVNVHFWRTVITTEVGVPGYTELRVFNFLTGDDRTFTPIAFPDNNVDAFRYPSGITFPENLGLHEYTCTELSSHFIPIGINYTQFVAPGNVTPIEGVNNYFIITEGGTVEHKDMIAERYNGNFEYTLLTPYLPDMVSGDFDYYQGHKAGIVTTLRYDRDGNLIEPIRLQTGTNPNNHYPYYPSTAFRQSIHNSDGVFSAACPNPTRWTRSMNVIIDDTETNASNQNYKYHAEYEVTFGGRTFSWSEALSGSYVGTGDKFILLKNVSGDCRLQLAAVQFSGDTVNKQIAYIDGTEIGIFRSVTVFCCDYDQGTIWWGISEEDTTVRTLYKGSTPIYTFNTAQDIGLTGIGGRCEKACIYRVTHQIGSLATSGNAYYYFDSQFNFLFSHSDKNTLSTAVCCGLWGTINETSLPPSAMPGFYRLLNSLGNEILRLDNIYINGNAQQESVSHGVRCCPGGLLKYYRNFKKNGTYTRSLPIIIDENGNELCNSNDYSNFTHSNDSLAAWDWVCCGNIQYCSNLYSLDSAGNRVPWLFIVSPYIGLIAFSLKNGEAYNAGN